MRARTIEVEAKAQEGVLRLSPVATLTFTGNEERRRLLAKSEKDARALWEAQSQREALQTDLSSLTVRAHACSMCARCLGYIASRLSPVQD